MLILTFYFFMCFFICMVLVMIFFISSKSLGWDTLTSSVFECGFSSCFFSRFSFSIHYFVVALIFLFLDLELCMVFPLVNFFLSSMELWVNFLIFISVLLVGLLIEWGQGKLDWTF